MKFVVPLLFVVCYFNRVLFILNSILVTLLREKVNKWVPQSNKIERKIIIIIMGTKKNKKEER